MSGPLLLSIESSCDETGIALVEGGRRIHANVVASQVALHAATGGIVPEVAARAHLRWVVPVLDAAWADANVGWGDVDAVAVTYGPGLAGSLLVGVNFAKALAHVHAKPLIGVNHLEGHVEAGWLLDPGEDPAARPEPPFPVVALVVSGGHTFLVEMRDHGATASSARPSTTPRARRSTRSAGCSASTIPADRPSSAPPKVPRVATGASRGRGSARRTTSASAGSRRPPGGSSPRPEPRPGSIPMTRRRRSPRPRSPSSPGASRTRSSTSSSARRSVRRARPAPAPSSSVVASRRTPRSGHGSTTRRPSSGSRSWSRARGCAPTTAR